jgi:Uma2 family endonuclease
MSLARDPEQWTPEAYLAFERRSDMKHELIDGRIYAMSGASRAHAALSARLSGILDHQLRGRKCRAFSSDLRVKVPATGIYTYPDLSVVCGRVELEDERADTLLNPTLLAEILSPSTQAYDRGAKFRHYQSIDALQDYLLVSQDLPRLELFSRTDDGRWIYSVADGLAGRLELPSVGVTVNLAELYDALDWAEGVGPDGTTGPTHQPSVDGG